MKNLMLLTLLGIFIFFRCGKINYTTNGEAIYKTGKNLNGETLLNKKESSIKFLTSCQACHGKQGTRMKKVSIRFIDLSNAEKMQTPYNDSLFYRFLDHDLKSDGSKANIGVIWKMNNSDKKDLLDYLRSL